MQLAARPIEKYGGVQMTIYKRYCECDPCGVAYWVCREVAIGSDGTGMTGATGATEQVT